MMAGSVSRTQVVKFIRKGDKGEQGAVLRGPQRWGDCEIGYNFQSGASGEDFVDIVIYNDYYYICKKAHEKTIANFPGSVFDVNNGYWQLSDKIDVVATKLLLATYALVENLGVEAVEMKNSAGQIVFQVKDGNVICKTGAFENITVKGNITADTLNLAYVEGFNSSYKVANSALIYGEGYYYLPRLNDGECRQMLFICPMLTKITPLAYFRGQTTAVSIIPNGVHENAVRQYTCEGPGVFNLIGMGSDTSTNWYVFKLN